MPRARRGAGGREYGKRNQFANAIYGHLDFAASPGYGRPAGICRRGLLRRDGNHVQACLRSGLYLCAGGGEPGVVWLPVLCACDGRKDDTRRTFGPSYGHAGAQTHGAWRPNLHHFDPVLLRHERASRTRGAHAAVPVHLDGARLADNHDAAGAQAPRGRLGRGHRVRHRVRERRLQDGGSPATTPSPSPAPSAQP